jgi:hypothetical protein
MHRKVTAMRLKDEGIDHVDNVQLEVFVELQLG